MHFIALHNLLHLQYGAPNEYEKLVYTGLDPIPTRLDGVSRQGLSRRLREVEEAEMDHELSYERCGVRVVVKSSGS
jgi:hypothetical protein